MQRGSNITPFLTNGRCFLPLNHNICGLKGGHTDRFDITVSFQDLSKSRGLKHRPRPTVDDCHPLSNMQSTKQRRLEVVFLRGLLCVCHVGRRYESGNPHLWPANRAGRLYNWKCCLKGKETESRLVHVAGSTICQPPQSTFWIRGRLFPKSFFFCGSPLRDPNGSQAPKLIFVDPDIRYT